MAELVYGNLQQVYTYNNDIPTFSRTVFRLLSRAAPTEYIVTSTDYSNRLVWNSLPDSLRDPAVGQSCKSLCADVTVTCPLAESYIEGAARQAGSTVEMAASRKKEKYLRLMFSPAFV